MATRVLHAGNDGGIDMTDQRIITFSCLVTGLGAGILTGILIAPRSGDVSRKLILRKAQKVKRVVNTAANDGTRYISRRGTAVRDQAIDWIDRGKEVYRAAGKMVHAVL